MTAHSHPHPAHTHPGHAHHARASRGQRRLAIVLVGSILYMVAEAVGGWLTGSLALLADAGHMLSDSAALALSLFAAWFARRPATPQRTYGFYRAEILAALANGAALIAVSILIAVEAWRRLRNPEPVASAPMMAIAAGGLAVNLIAAAILHGARHDSLNIRGARLHVLSDALGSLGALAAGAIILATGWTPADPLASIAIAALVVYASWNLVRQSVAVLMEGTPHGLELDQIRDAIRSIPGVLAVHDLHVWTITTGFDSLSAHVATAAGPADIAILRDIRRTLRARFNIAHITIQIEPPDFGERHEIM